MMRVLHVDPDVEALATREKRQKIRYAKINIAEFLEGVKGLKIEEIGFYTLILFRMYDNMGALPDDDRIGAADMRCDIRVYRRIKALLIAKGKLEVENGKLMNYRVAREIMELKAELRRRSEAATEREERKALRLADQSEQPFALASARLGRTSNQKTNKINGRNSTTVPQDCENSAGIQNPLKEVLVKGESENPTKAAQQKTAPPRLGIEEIKHLRERILAAANGSVGNGEHMNLLNMSIPIMWVEGGADLERDVVPTIQRLAHGKRIRNWQYFTEAISEARQTREKGLPQVLTREDDFAARRKAEEMRKLKAIVGNGPIVTGFRDD